MPLDGHSYLVAQGWGGKGTGLREGAISRPIAVSQKKNLAGLGKDRDEAFPFWDHLFSAAAKSIIVKCFSDDEDSGEEASTSTEVTLKRTSTGILSTRRPVEGTPATSGTATPSTPDETTPRLSLMANAKRDAARRNLYSRFFKGPVIGPETIAAEEKRLAALVSEAFAKQNATTESVTITEHIEIKTVHSIVSVDLEVSKSHCKKRSSKAVEGSSIGEEDETAKRERKRRRKEKRKEEETGEQCEKEHRKKTKRKSKEEVDDVEEGSSAAVEARSDGSNEEKETKAERKARKEEKKLKALRKLKDLGATDEHAAAPEEEATRQSRASKNNKEKKKKTLDTDTTTESKVAISIDHDGEEKKKKKKRKRGSDDSE